jgi:hypothetical protein
MTSEAYKNQLSYDIAKKILRPQSYSEHQEIKQKLKEYAAQNSSSRNTP